MIVVVTRAVPFLVVLAAVLGVAAAAAAKVPLLPVERVRFDYRTHDGRTSYAIVLLPGWWAQRGKPALPLVIAPHGRNTLPESTAKRWRDLPTRGGFAVVLPAGWGRVLQFDSWGYPGQIADLARMPALTERAVPGFRYLRDRLYAIGESMGGQEVLDLLALHPKLFAGVIAFDPAVDLATRYYDFPRLPDGTATQQKARLEVGGTPLQEPGAYILRSPIDYVRRIAFSGVPLQIWWSIDDQVIRYQAEQAGRFYTAVLDVNPRAPITPYVGRWKHTAEGIADTQLPHALARIGLLPARWLTDDPLRLHHGPNATPAERRPTDAEVRDMVARFEAAQTRDQEQTQENANRWRDAFIAAASLAATALLILALSLRRTRAARSYR